MKIEGALRATFTRNRYPAAGGRGIFTAWFVFVFALPSLSSFGRMELWGRGPMASCGFLNCVQAGGCAATKDVAVPELLPGRK